MTLNILALLLVLLFLFGSLWLISRFTNKRKKIKIPLDGDFEVSLESLQQDYLNCPACNGTGAENILGDIYACESCLGTGVVNSPSHN